ncbi:MAG TPA: HAD family phosphatase [Jiangellaceae bacterium]
MSDAPAKTVVFDLGGVLVDWDPRYLYRTLMPSEAEVERFLTEVATPEWNAAQDVGRTWAEAVETLSGQFPEHADLIAAYDERWLETIRGDIPGTVEILGQLRAAGTPLYALTNWSAEKFPLARERFGWLAWFEGIVVSGEEQVVKPDPRIYRILLDRHGLDPAATVFIDDSRPNVDAAAAVGITALHFTSPEGLRDDLDGLGFTLDDREISA